MELNAIQSLIVDFQRRPLPNFTPRDLRLSFVKNMSLSVTGCRRSGKTYRTYQLIRELTAAGTPMESICRLQFNDHRLSRLGREGLDLIHRAYDALYPEKRGRETLFIFDEIHRIEGWEDYLLHLLDDPRHRVLVTGSTSRLKRGNIASGLRGKNLTVELYPFSFAEFLRHHGVPEDTVSSAGQAHLRHMLMRYLEQGGFPGLLEADAHLHLELLQNYWDAMMLRDVLEAHPEDSPNLGALTFFAQALVARNACPMTVRGIMKEMSTAGLSFTPEALYRYLRHLEEAYIAFAVPIYSPSSAVRHRNPQKVYLIDWALAEAVSPGPPPDAGRKLENLVYLELRRRGCEVAYFRTRQGHEIDFVARAPSAKGRGPALIQVCYSLASDEVRERELRALPAAARLLKADEVFIVTWDEEKRIEREGLTVHIVPAWKWLLGFQPGATPASH